MRHLKTSKKIFLIVTALFYTLLFDASYSSIPFIALSQILWLYRVDGGDKKTTFSSFLTLNSLILILCLPWIIFLGLNFKGQPMMDPHHTEDPGSPLSIIYWILNDWVPHAPLMIVSVILLILFPIFSKYKKNALILLAVFILPIGGLYLYCKLIDITHFITSRYFINFLPFFLITMFLSLEDLEVRFERFKRYVRLKLLFVILLIVSNLTILPLYYISQKQDFRGLVSYLKLNLKVWDKIFDGDRILTPGILHYFGVYPEGRHYAVRFKKEAGEITEYKKSFVFRNDVFTIYYSNTCCTQYISDGSCLWIAVGKESAKRIKVNSAFVFKGYFDGSFLNLNRFPTDASIYLFLLDPLSPDEKGIDMPID